MTYPRPVFQILFISALILPLTVSAIETPELIKSDASPAVYWLQNGLRRPFPLLAIYQSWFGSNFSIVNTVPQTTLANFPLGKSIPFNKGSLVKIQTDPKVYHVTDEIGSLEWVSTEEDFKSRGFSFKEVRDVPDSLFGDYSIKYFATPILLISPSAPTSTPEIIVAPTSTSTPAIQPSAIEIQNVIVKNEKTVDGPRTTVSFTTTQSAEITLTHSDSVSTSTIARSVNTKFSISFATGYGSFYTFSIQAKSADAASKYVGNFISYADVVVTALPLATSVTAFTATPPIVVAAFAVKNNSTDPRIFNEAWFAIESLAKSEIYYGRTVQIVRYDNKIVGDNLGLVSFPSGSSGTLQYKRQKFTFSETVAAGETKTYAIIIKKVLSANETIGAADSQFKITLQSMNFFGDTTLLLPQDALVKIGF